MEWLTQNWIWLIVIAGMIFMMLRGRHGGLMGGCCGGHDMAHEPRVPQDRTAESGHSVPPSAKQSAEEQPPIQGAPGVTQPAAGLKQNTSAHRHHRRGCC